VLQRGAFETVERPRRETCVLAEFVLVVDARRTWLLVALVGAIVGLAVPAALGQSAYDKKASVDRKISGLREEIEAAKSKEGTLTSEIEAAAQRIDTLDGDIDSLSALISELEADLAVLRDRLERLREQIELQTREIEYLKEQYAIAQRHLEERLVELYQSDETDAFGILLQVESLGDLVDQLEYVDSIGRQDQALTIRLLTLRADMRKAREKTRVTKAEVAEQTEVLAQKTAEQVAAREALVAQQDALAAARANQRSVLAGVRQSRHTAQEDLEDLQAESAALAAQIRAAASSSSGGSGGGSTGSGASSSGFIWPVNGVVTSGFGWRWGRMHEGIDIGAPSGTPIRAVAAGTVIFAGWMGGYGNLVVIDHGNGLATAYGHLSAIHVGGGSVSQGTVIGAVGSTGSSTGPHLHFEVRVNGSPVDPLGYL
jgi:murein DD-endopeptidase MepM/ murein hydrolase activator NlpD